jgi:pyruvate dehydrogenase E1 component alpha subunit
MNFSREQITAIYRQLYTIRIFETRCIKLYRNGMIRGYFHPYLGEEAIAVGVCAALESDDYILSTHRGHGHCIAKGASVDRMTAELLGKNAGYCRGLGGSMHIADVESGNLGANGVVGAGIPIAVGAALASRIKNDNKVTVAFSSDGATCNGTFAESLSVAAMWDLPLIIVIENNQYAVSTPIESSARETDLYKRALGYGVVTSGVDGNDVRAVFEKAREAVSLCRDGKGPVVIEAKTYRHQGHHVNDPGTYMPKEKLEYYLKKDPVGTGRKYLGEYLNEDEIKALEGQIEKEMEEAVEFALAGEEMTPEEFFHNIQRYN